MSVLCTSHSNYIKSAEVFKNIFTAILCKLKSDARSLIRKDSSEVIFFLLEQLCLKTDLITKTVMEICTYLSCENMHHVWLLLNLAI